MMIGDDLLVKPDRRKVRGGQVNYSPNEDINASLGGLAWVSVPQLLLSNRVVTGNPLTRYSSSGEMVGVAFTLRVIQRLVNITDHRREKGKGGRGKQVLGSYSDPKFSMVVLIFERNTNDPIEFLGDN